MPHRFITNYALLFPYAAPYFGYVLSLTFVPALVPAALGAWERVVAYAVAAVAAGAEDSSSP